MSKQRSMVIHFNDGSKVAYDFPPQQENPALLMSKTERLLEMQYLCIEAEGGVMLYPVSNIKSIQVYPTPDKLPEFVIKGASLADIY